MAQNWFYRKVRLAGSLTVLARRLAAPGGESSTRQVFYRKVRSLGGSLAVLGCRLAARVWNLVFWMVRLISHRSAHAVSVRCAKSIPVAVDFGLDRRCGFIDGILKIDARRIQKRRIFRESLIDFRSILRRREGGRRRRFRHIGFERRIHQNRGMRSDRNVDRQRFGLGI